MKKERQNIRLEDFQKILISHNKWIRSNGKEGQKANLSNCKLFGQYLGDIDLSNADLSNADLSWARLDNAILRQVNLSKANLSRAVLSRADLEGADLSGATLIGADLSETNLSKANLGMADLSRAILHHAKLRWANLTRASLEGTDLTDASMIGATLIEAKLRMTRVSRRKDLAYAEVNSYEGIIFDEQDEEKIRADRSRRDAKADEAFGSQPMGTISFLLPNNFRPAQVGQVLIALNFLYEGVRLAMTAPYESMDELFNKAMRPELYGAYEDRNALRLGQFRTGSLIGEAIGNGGIITFIIRLINICQEFKVQRARNAAKIAEAELKEAEWQKVKRELYGASGSGTPESTDTLPATSESRLLLPAMEMKKLEEEVEAHFGQLDHLSPRTDVATRVVEQAINTLSLLKQKLGGEFKIDGQDIPLDLPDEPEGPGPTAQA